MKVCLDSNLLSNDFFILDLSISNKSQKSILVWNMYFSWNVEILARTLVQAGT